MTSPSRIDSLIPYLEQGQPAIRVVLSRAEGSTPREMGADMMIYGDHFSGTIGGGTLEHEVIIEARALMKADRRDFRTKRQYPLGPTLGQCCGGFVEVLFEHILAEDLPLWREIIKGDHVFYPDDAAVPPRADADGARGITLAIRRRRTPLYLYGAGHVGRAVIELTSGLALDPFWIDTDDSRFPDDISQHVEKVIAKDPAQIAPYAPSDAIHLVMSYSHQLDLEICLAVLEQNRFARLGLIGSKTKKARFLKALDDAGVDDERKDQLICPIGLPEIGGKDPFRVALSITAQLAEWTREDSLEQS